MENENNEPEQGTTQEAELVRVEDSAMEDLDAFLASPEQADGVEPEAADKPESEPEAGPEKKLETREPSSAPEQTPPTEDAQREVTREEFNRQQRQLEGIELLVKRRTSELADVRKRLTDLIQTKAPGLQERFQEDPVTAANDLADLRDAQKALADIKTEEAQLETHSANQRAVLSHVNLTETPLQEIAQVFLSDGIAPEAVDNFLRNPWAVPATTTIQAAKRAKAERYLRVLIPEFKKLRDENTKLKSGRGDVLRQVDAAARSTPGVTGSSGGARSTPDQDLSNIPVHKMTEAQLETYLNKASRSK